MSSRQQAGRSLPRIADEVLASLHQHRLLSTPQVHALHFPGYAKAELGLRAAGRVMQQLEAHDPPLVAHVGTTERTPTHLYYLTAEGLTATVCVPRLEDRPRLVTREAAAGPLQAHTLQVTEACLAFVLAARERGDDCPPLAWRDEIDHPITAAKAKRNEKAGNVVRSDAVLRYTLIQPGGRVALLARFIELDRGTYSEELLAAKLRRYAQMHAFVAPGGGSTPAWRAVYPYAFPEILVVFAGDKPRPLIEARMRTVLALLEEDDVITSAGPDFLISCVLLEDLITLHRPPTPPGRRLPLPQRYVIPPGRGPFAPVFARHDRPRAPVDWLGQRPELALRVERDVQQGQGTLV